MEAIRQGDIPGVQLRRRVDVPDAAPAAVWPFWLEAEKLSLWLCDRARIEPGPPVVLRFETSGPQSALRQEYAEVFEQIVGQRLVLGLRQLEAGWTAATKVTLELAARGTGCHVMVFQEGFQQLPLSIGLTAWEQSRARWGRALDRLVRVVATASPAKRS